MGRTWLYVLVSTCIRRIYITLECRRQELQKKESKWGTRESLRWVRSSELEQNCCLAATGQTCSRSKSVSRRENAVNKTVTVKVTGVIRTSHAGWMPVCFNKLLAVILLLLNSFQLPLTIRKGCFWMFWKLWFLHKLVARFVSLIFQRYLQTLKPLLIR